MAFRKTEAYNQIRTVRHLLTDCRRCVEAGHVLEAARYAEQAQLAAFDLKVYLRKQS